MTPEEALVVTLARWNAVPFAWDGANDCAMSVCAHCELVTGRDAGALWRGTYHDRESAAAAIVAVGGIRAGMEACLSAIGLRRTERPRRGDPVCAMIGGREIAGIHLGDWSTFRICGRGRIDLPVKPIAAWRLV
jgi:hypothetical protein